MSLFEKLNYGDVPFGVRLVALGQALRSIQNPNVERTGLAMMAQYQQKAQEEKKAAAEFAKKQEMANRLADKLEMSNPELAAALRADPSLVDDYGKGTITDSFQSKRDERQRGWSVEDRDFNAGLQERGWDRQDTRAAQDRAFQEKMQEDRQAQEVYMEERKRQHEQALREGRLEDAKLIAEDFFMTTGSEIDAGVSPVPGGASRASPVPGGASSASPIPTPGEPPELAVWRDKFKDPNISATESAILTAAFKSALTQGDYADPNAAAQAAALAYQKIINDRNDTITASAAQKEAEIKAAEAAAKARAERAGTTEAAIAKTEQSDQTADNVLTAIDNGLAALENEASGKPNEKQGALAQALEPYLPATGLGSGLAGYVSESNARAIYNAVDTVQSNLALDKLLELKATSTTGASGLGALNLKELEALQKAITALDPTDQNFKQNLMRVRDLYANSSAELKAFSEDLQNLRKNPSPEMRAAFDELYGVDAHLRFVGP